MENDGPLSITEKELGERSDPDKTAVECICPKCGERHIINFHWIGRGTPRKFCSLCKNSL
jgi:predicted RNA-binding Zn-ribbon protein involved in translation (DUF1610 family)